jgi:hypothetical protein
MLTCPSRKVERMRLLTSLGDNSWPPSQPKHEASEHGPVSTIPRKTPAHSTSNLWPLLSMYTPPTSYMSVATSIWRSTQVFHTLSNRVETPAIKSFLKPHRNAAMSQNTTNGIRVTEIDVCRIDSKMSSSQNHSSDHISLLNADVLFTVTDARPCREEISTFEQFADRIFASETNHLRRCRHALHQTYFQRIGAKSPIRGGGTVLLGASS